MTALTDEISESLRGSGQRASFPDALTAREVEVLRLLALGRSNKDISKVLSISLNTVATHVRSILNKTCCANRTEAAAYAIRHDLAEPERPKDEANGDEGGRRDGIIHDRADIRGPARAD